MLFEQQGSCIPNVVAELFVTIKYLVWSITPLDWEKAEAELTVLHWLLFVCLAHFISTWLIKSRAARLCVQITKKNDTPELCITVPSLGEFTDHQQSPITKGNNISRKIEFGDRYFCSNNKPSLFDCYCFECVWPLYVAHRKHYNYLQIITMIRICLLIMPM